MRTSALLASVALSFVWAMPSNACREAWREPSKGAVLRIAHYPTHEALRAYLDLSSVPGSADLENAVLRLRRAGDPSVVAESTVDARKASEPGGLQTIVPLPRLRAGEWELQSTFSTRACTDIPGPAARFTVASFTWERVRVEADAAVIPPFTPLEIAGNHVRAVLRDHTLTDTGLFAQVEAAGAPILAGPMRWVVVADGMPRSVEPGKASVKSIDPGRVEVESTSAAGPLSLRTRGVFEMDGLYRIRVAIEGAPQTRVDRLDLVIPLAPARATLMNAITDETRVHYFGKPPAQPGNGWRSSDAPRHQLDAGFVPYVWLGDEERGIAWLSESTRDYWFEPGDAMAEVRRRGEALELVIHFASSPGVLGRRRELDFAVQATPVKPRPDHAGSWRSWQLACDAGARWTAICPLGSGYYWGTESPYGHLTPRDGDESVLRWMADARARRSSIPPIDAWLDRHRVPSEEREVVRASLAYTMNALAEPSRAVVAYMDSQGSAWGPEFATFTDEWRAAPFGDREGGDEPRAKTLPVVPRASYRDRLIWHLDRLLASGAADGVFFDNTYLRASFDDYVGTAYRDERGRLHPGVELYALRELLKRAQTLVWQRRRGWWNVAHLTTTPISAIHGFAGLSLDGEWQYGDADFQDRFSPDRMRAQALGSQLGTVPVWLPGIETADERRRTELTRQLFGVTAIHEVRVMDSFRGELGRAWEALRSAGYGDPACRIGHYWDRDPMVSVRGVDAKTLVIRCQDRMTALVVGYGDGGSAELVATAATGSFKCRDVERRWERIERTRDGCRVLLTRHDVRLIAMEPQ